mgnify:CR=1 FL=1
MSDITSQSLSLLVKNIKEKKLSSEDVTKAFVERSEKSKELNSYITEDFSNDLKEFGVESDAPDLFSTETQNARPEELLSSNDEEEDDLEIPAFLRRQKN